MHIATWNINSLRARLDQVLDWVEAERPDILCLQETKVTDQEFPEDELGDLDYDVVYTGERSYNGVAIATKDEASAVVKRLPGDAKDAQKRMIAATVGELRVVNAYFPNGKTVGSPDFAYKLAWYARMRDFLAREEAPVILCGDFNVCPADLDAYDGAARQVKIFGTPEERAAYRALTELGLTDAFRHLHPEAEEFTWWDYRDAGFERGAGLRIDLFLVSAPLLARVERCVIHRDQRLHENASDHAPVSLYLADVNPG